MIRDIRIVPYEGDWMLMVGPIPLLLMTNEEVYELYKSASQVPLEH